MLCLKRRIHACCALRGGYMLDGSCKDGRMGSGCCKFGEKGEGKCVRVGREDEGTSSNRPELGGSISAAISSSQ